MSAKILPLPEVVRSQLRSGVTITSVAQCVEELVLNSLDADATCIAVRVDLCIFRIQVVDNGVGVQQADLKYLGRRHATSKCHSLGDLNNHLCHYGFRGEALASAVDLSAIVDITTRPLGSTHTLTKLFTYGKEKSSGTSKINRPSTGTTVTIQDFMYNMPVRRKLIKEAIDIENIRSRLESFALMHPKVAFSLRNDKTNAMIVQTKKSSGIMSTFLQLFSAERAQGLAEVQHNVDQFTVSGYISTQPHLTKALQFVYVNKRVILKTKIHKMINGLLTRSSIISSRLHPSSGGPGKTPSSPPKGMKLYGIFVLNIECPYSEYDICLDPTKTLVEFRDWNKLLLCIEELILKFAQEENLGISLDERYRLSGKDQEEEEEEEEESLSQGSQSRLQSFSLKRGGERGEEPGAPRQKYGRSLCTQDNLLAVHSALVKRAKKKLEVSESPSKSHTNEPSSGQCISALEVAENCVNNENLCDGNLRNADNIQPLESKRTKIKNKNIYREYSSEDDDSVMSMNDNTYQTETATMNHTSQCNNYKRHHLQYSKSSFEHEELPRNSLQKESLFEDQECEQLASALDQKSEGMSSLEEFRKIVKSTLEGNNAECDQGTVDLPRDASTSELQKEGNTQERAAKSLSTLEEFLELYNSEEEKSRQEAYKTPAEAIRHTPSSPPPLRPPQVASHTTSPTTPLSLDTQSSTDDFRNIPELPTNARTRLVSERGDSECSGKCKTLGISLNDRRSDKKVSLSKSLSEKFKKHQNKSKTLTSLQKFGYQKTHPTQKLVESCVISDNRDDGSSTCPEPVKYPGSNSQSVSTEVQDERNGDCLDVSFRFQPVITKELDLDAVIDTYIPDITDLQYIDVGKTNKEPVTAVMPEGVDGGGGEGRRNTSPAGRNSALLHIAEMYSSAPDEDCECIPEKPNIAGTQQQVAVPLISNKHMMCQQIGESIFLRHEEKNLQVGLGSSERNLVSTDVRPVDQSVNFKGRKGLSIDMAWEGNGQSMSSDTVIANVNGCQQPDIFQGSPCTSGNLCGKLPNLSSENNMTQQTEKGGNQGSINKTNLGLFPLSPTTASTQPFGTSDTSLLEKPKVHGEDHLKETFCCVQESQGFTLQHSEHIVTNAAIGCTSPLAKQNGSTERSEEPKKPSASDSLDQVIDSEKLKHHSPGNKNETCLGGSLHLLSLQMKVDSHMQGDDASSAPLSGTLEALVTHHVSPTEQGAVEVGRKESSDETDAGPELRSVSPHSPDPFSESLHFSQLTLPSEGDTEGPSLSSSSLQTLTADKSELCALSSTNHSSYTGTLKMNEKQMPLCKISFQGKMIHGGDYREESTEKVQEDNVHHSLSISLSPAKTVTVSGDSTKDGFDPKPLQAILPGTFTSLESDQSLGKKLENSSSLSLCTESSHQNIAEQSDLVPNKTRTLSTECRWKEVVGEGGRTVYVDLQTGNTSYDPPVVREIPEWTSSQPLGAPLLKVPLTHEPWYIPRGKTEKNRDNFTLSHGFTELMSWKKTIEMKKQKSRERTSMNPDSSSVSTHEGSTKAASGTSSEVQEAIETLFQDTEADEDSIKWTEKPRTLHGPAQPSEVAQICQMWEAPDFAMDSEVLNSGPDQGTSTEKGVALRSGARVRVYNIVHPYKFTRDMLQSCKVLGQLDRKFIACSLMYPTQEPPNTQESQLVVLFDQHAVHERVRLEAIIQENYETLASGESVLRSAALTPPIELTLPEDEVRLMAAYSKVFNQRGLHFLQISPSKVSFQLIPSCLVAREASETRHKRCQTAGAIVESVVRDLCHTLQQTGGVVGLIPRPIIHVLNSNACRGAIKFGDELTGEQCQDLISSLHSCQLPFQCAHGRPSIVPVVNLTHLASLGPKINKPNLRRLRESMEAKSP